MKDREFDTILGKARLPGSSHWTDEEYEIWLKHERAYAAYVDELIQKMEAPVRPLVREGRV